MSVNQVRCRMVRTMHPYGFRSGKWAEVIASDQRESDGRPTWLVRFDDGMTDVWVADDEQGEYEFGGTDGASEQTP